MLMKLKTNGFGIAHGKPENAHIQAQSLIRTPLKTTKNIDVWFSSSTI